MSDADQMYQALITLRNESIDSYQSLKQLADSGAALEPQALLAELVDTRSILADFGTRLAEILSPDDVTEAAALPDGAEDDEDDEEMGDGLEPEEAETLRRLLTDHKTMLSELLPTVPDGDPRRDILTRDIADCERMIGVVNDLELVSDDEAAAE